MSKKILEIKGVEAGYDGETALKDVNLDVYSDDFIGVVGPNGGGKTTFLKVILGMLKPYRGTVNFLNGGSKERMREIGYLPQYIKIDDKFPISVFDVVLSGLTPEKKLFFHYKRKDKQRVEEMLEKMGIQHLKDKTIGELSGGQMQRVFLSRAIISSPKLLVLDEPNTFVDNQFEGELYELLKKLNDEMAIILVTHDLGIITPYVKTIACINKEFHYHKSNKITEKQLSAYNCPIQLITHGKIPHTVLKEHND
jgi:zinc transport system ATP-binding protein